MSTAPDPKAGLSELADLLVGIETYQDDAPIRDALVLTAMAQAYACGFKAGVEDSYDEPHAVIVLPAGMVRFPLPTVAHDEPWTPEINHDRCAAFIAEHYQETAE